MTARRPAALALLLCLTGGLAPAPALADPPWRHGLTLLGTPKYPADFTHFAYADPEAPKGGLLRLGQQGSFDNLNLIVSGVKGDLEGEVPLIYDTLMTEALDEPFTSYGLLAEGVQVAEDLGSVTYRLRPQAKWHDGAPVTPADVIFSFGILKENSPLYASYYHNVAKVEAVGEREVRFTFSETGNRELPQIVGQMPVLPKHWWEGRDGGGHPRKPTETTLEIPLGSGPYRIAKLDPGRSITYERVADYWGRDIPVNKGRFNFDALRNEYFRDGTVLIEAFKADQFDWRSENIARNWATAYDGFPAVREGRIVKEEFPSRGSGIMQCFTFNLRRAKFADPRVRRALNLAFDFEEMNRTLFYGLYKRIDSYFFGTELAASGLPEGREREILESVRDKIPEKVFTEPYRNPVNGSAEAQRTNLREAVRLLQAAGYAQRGGQMVEAASGQPLTIEFLGYDNSAERVVLPYRQQLERLGIKVMLRIVDPAQYQNLVRGFDFDALALNSWPESLSPGNEQRDFWGSAAADRPGSRNLAGIKDAGIDALIEKVIFARDRDELVAATRALDRVLLAHDYVVPQWAAGVSRTLRWNRFAHPAVLPTYGGSGFPWTWWYDRTLAAKTGAAR
ncbi:extracellular solute-binding protein family 5 [Methylobacterium sp. 4-46]|uniref:extracellular solute-binding protein n=1 Tax=unclassified Methylobacterium TaxID=2615210 RepID=UPI000152DF5B|nr:MULTISPECIES: extracellular solute-binding protein [Methylobacterium]ACA16114.1 extracellular solute-binding protein family 5 [Methylobacterium sp. 4-46]WFT81823.1 extracellular solute-binding protein [Methylobacterium nodulans]